MFCFTIRDLLWLVVVVALATAWWVDRSRLGNLLRELQPSLTLEIGISMRDGARYQMGDDCPSCVLGCKKDDP